MSTTFAKLPRSLEIEGVTHVLHWKTKSHAVYQSYTLPVTPSQNPLVDRAPQIAGANWFHVYRVIQHEPGEELGDKLATYTDLQAAMNFVAQQEQLA